MKTFKYVCIFCAGFLLLSCTERNTGSNKRVKEDVMDVVTLSDEQIKNAGVELGRPEIKPMSGRITVNGKVDVPPQGMVSVSFPLGGYFKDTRLLPGMRVLKGGILAVIEDQSFVQLQQDYLIAKAKLHALSADYERQKLLNANKTSSDKAFEQVQSDYQTQQIQLKALGEKLLMLGISPSKLSVNRINRSINILSPINGFVSRVNANIGKYINPSDVLFELVNTDDLHLALTVFEKDLDLVSPGQKVTAHLTSDTSAIYHAGVILKGQDLDENRSTTVHCHFTGNTTGLVPGMFLHAEIEGGEKDVLAVPEAALVRYGDKEYVFVAEGKNRFRQLEVGRGRAENGFVEVKTGVKGFESKMIATRNAYSILMKMKNTGEDE